MVPLGSPEAPDGVPKVAPVRRNDWLVGQLPVGMMEDGFFLRFVSLFQDLATGLLEGVDNIPNSVDVTVAPPALVRWLGSWIGIENIDSSLPVELQRRIVQESAKILAWRGTRRGLVRFLELMTDGPVEVTDSGGVFRAGEVDNQPPHVWIRVDSTGWVPERDFVALIRDELPANVTFEVFIRDRRLWPPVFQVATPLSASPQPAPVPVGVSTVSGSWSPQAAPGDWAGGAGGQASSPSAGWATGAEWPAPVAGQQGVGSGAPNGAALDPGGPGGGWPPPNPAHRMASPPPDAGTGDGWSTPTAGYGGWQDLNTASGGWSSPDTGATGDGGAWPTSGNGGPPPPDDGGLKPVPDAGPGGGGWSAPQAAEWPPPAAEPPAPADGPAEAWPSPPTFVPPTPADGPGQGRSPADGPFGQAPEGPPGPVPDPGEGTNEPGKGESGPSAEGPR